MHKKKESAAAAGGGGPGPPPPPNKKKNKKKKILKKTKIKKKKKHYVFLEGRGPEYMLKAHSHLIHLFFNCNLHHSFCLVFSNEGGRAAVALGQLSCV